MKKRTRHRGAQRWLIAVATLPLLATTCTERSLDFILGSDFFDDRSNADRAEDILDDIGNLFDDVF